MKTNMNIVEAYIKFNGQLVILISGLSGCGKTSVGKKIAHTFNIELIDQYKYYKEDYNNKITLPDGTEIINYYTDDAVDWDKLNNDINKVKSSGVVVVGFAFPTDKITTKVDYHIHLSISKKECLERRRQYVESHKNKLPEEAAEIGTLLEKLKMNQLIYPYYLDTNKRSKINKFINLASLTDENVFDIVFDLIIDHINQYIDWFNKYKYFEWKASHNKTTDTTSIETTTTETTSTDTTNLETTSTDSDSDEVDDSDSEDDLEGSQLVTDTDDDSLILDTSEDDY